VTIQGNCRPIRAAAVGATLLALAGCTDFGDPIVAPAAKPATVTITSPSGSAADLAVGAKLQFAALVRDDRGAVVPGAVIGWESSDATVTTIDSLGVARGVDIGTADITASFGTLRSSAVHLNVVVGSVEVVRILGAVTRDVPLGGTLQFEAEALDGGNNVIPGTRFEWSVDDPRVASIDTTGSVRGLTRGQTPVRAAAGGRQSDPVVLSVVVNAPDFARDVQPIFDANCTLCHGFDGNLNLAAGASYGNLVGVRAFSSPLLRVTPGDPAHSFLYVKIALCPGPDCSGVRMPRGGAPLPAADIQIIHDWIAGGAPP
jgi:hypothetical protein